ncbi:MAG: T9SS type A sorting domain-containing protein, partial [ANME-2 cluster archaeon]
GELENLNQTYANLITAGSELWDAIDISPDGRFIAGNGTNAISGLDEGFLIDTSGVTLVDHLDSSPAIFALYQNFPNPFNPVTKIRYQIQDSELVKLKVYDISGKEVITLVNENKAAGSYEVDFIATLLPSGTYFYRLQAGPFSEIKKMLLIK